MTQHLCGHARLPGPVQCLLQSNIGSVEKHSVVKFGHLELMILGKAIYLLNTGIKGSWILQLEDLRVIK